MKKPRKPSNQFKRAKAMVEANLYKHAVVFTVSLGRSYFVNRINPDRRTSIQPVTEALFDPNSNVFNKIKLDWKFYPVVALKDAFGNYDKQYIHDVGYTLNNVNWSQAIEESLVKANEYLGQITPRFRMNCALVFCPAKAPMTVEKIEQIISMDKSFYIWDEDREIRTQQEIDADGLELIKKLEAIV
ncbi:MAG: hypothetical protein KTR16_11440 [Acidiferrobacterales bacterium]|nr:hypothetical protein [Acidiferrobacterales bacterium]